MSWSMYFEDKTAAEAKEYVAAVHAPQTIKDYFVQGIDGAVAYLGEDVLFTSQSHGHVCEGHGSYEVTTASINLVPKKPTT